MKTPKQKALEKLKKCFALLYFGHPDGEAYQALHVEGHLLLSAHPDIGESDLTALHDALVGLRVKRLLKKAGGRLPVKTLFKKLGKSMNRPVDAMAWCERWNCGPNDDICLTEQGFNTLKKAARPAPWVCEQLWLLATDIAEEMDEDCVLDQRGYCPNHLWYSTRRACPAGRAKALLATLTRASHV